LSLEPCTVPLLTVGTGHPSGKIRTLTVALEAALSHSLVSANLAVQAMLASSTDVHSSAHIPRAVSTGSSARPAGVGS
jgi:hypothetical protein